MENRKQITNICLLRKEGLTLFLEKEGDVFTDIKNENTSILPEELIAEREREKNISERIKDYAQKLKRKEYYKKLNYQIENLLFLTGAGSSYNFGDGDKKGKLMFNLWDDAIELVGGKENMDTFCEAVKYADKDENGEYLKNLEKLLSLAEKAKDYIEGLNMLSNMRLCSNVPAQSIIQTALGGYQSVEEYLQPGGRIYEQREFIYNAINDIPGLSAVKPKAAFYIFPKMDTKKFNILDDEKFVLDLLKEKKVLLTHGRGFNWAEPDHFRIVYLPNIEQLKDATGKIADFLSGYHQQI